MVIYFLSGIPTLLGGEAVAMNAVVSGWGTLVCARASRPQKSSCLELRSPSSYAAMRSSERI